MKLFYLAFCMLCSVVPLRAQKNISKIIVFSIKIDDLFSFDAQSTGIIGNGDGDKITVSGYEENADLSDGGDWNYLFKVVSANKTAGILKNESNGFIQTSVKRKYWFGSEDVLVQTNDYSYFKNYALKIKTQDNNFFNKINVETVNIKLKITVTGKDPSLSSIRSIKMPGIRTFNPTYSESGYVKVWRNGKVVKELLVNYAGGSTNTYKLETYQGDKVVFETDSKDYPGVRGLTDTNIMRWAGESIFMINEIEEGAPKPFLFFDSNVHGVKLRKYPILWREDGKHLYPAFEIDPVKKDKKYLTWIANGRYETEDKITNAGVSPLISIFKPFKTTKEVEGFPDYNKFYEPKDYIDVQRNNQKEGLNMELLEAYKKGARLVAGLDPDELIYKDFNQSKIVGTTAKDRLGSSFSFIKNDPWKTIKPEERLGINESMKNFLSYTLNETKKSYNYQYKGSEIVDENLYINRNNEISIQDSVMDLKRPQPMFNNKVPVFYNDAITNEPAISSRIIDFFINGQVFKINLVVLSPLEVARKRIDDAYTLTEADRKKPVVNFYGIIKGPIHVARKQKVTYSVGNIPTNSNHKGTFYLVYSNEDSRGILKEVRKNINFDHSQEFTIGGGGYHEITLRYNNSKEPNREEEDVIIAGKELMDIDLRFIFSPNADAGDDFSFNPKFTFKNSGVQIDKIGGYIRLNENKANGKVWFLEDSTSFLNEDYGYANHTVVKTYTLARNERMVLTVLDADPHTFVHYKPDFYLSERRLSKRLTDKDLETRIQWFLALDQDFKTGVKEIGKGRYCEIYPAGHFKGVIKPHRGDFFVKAVYEGTSEIIIKVAQPSSNIDEMQPSTDLGTVKQYKLSLKQQTILNELTKSDFYTRPIVNYRIFKVQDILSSYTYGEKNGKGVANSEKTRFRQVTIAGEKTEVGEDKRFAAQNNYDNRFIWEFRYNNKEIDKQPYVNFKDSPEIKKTYEGYVKKWFPKNWVRHMDSPPRSPEIPANNDNADYNVKLFNQSQRIQLQNYSNQVLYEPWQVRLPWIVNAGVNGYKTRFNIKCIYSIDDLFKKDSKDALRVGDPYGLTEVATVYDKKVGSVIPDFSNDYKEMQEFYTMLKNQEIVVVYMPSLYNQINNSKQFGIKVKDMGDNNIFEKVINIIDLTSQSNVRTQAGDSLSINNDLTELFSPNSGNSDEFKSELLNVYSNSSESKSELLNVYPNPSSTGEFRVEINAQKENSQLDLELTNIRGVVFYKFKKEKINGRFSTTIGAKDLPIGVYLLKVRINEFVETKKLIVE